MPSNTAVLNFPNLLKPFFYCLSLCASVPLCLPPLPRCLVPLLPPLQIPQIRLRAQLQQRFIHQFDGLLDIGTMQHFHGGMHITQGNGD